MTLKGVRFIEWHPTQGSVIVSWNYCSGCLAFQKHTPTHTPLHPHTHLTHSTQLFWDPLQTSKFSSWSSALVFHILPHSICPKLTNLSGVSSTQGDFEKGVPFLLFDLKILWTVSWGNLSAYLICLFFLRDHYFFVIWFVLRIVLSYISSLCWGGGAVSNKRVNLVLITSSWPEVEI